MRPVSGTTFTADYTEPFPRSAAFIVALAFSRAPFHDVSTESRQFGRFPVSVGGYALLVRWLYIGHAPDHVACGTIQPKPKERKKISHFMLRAKRAIAGWIVAENMWLLDCARPTSCGICFSHPGRFAAAEMAAILWMRMMEAVRLICS